jgi:ribosomal protein S9
MADRFYATGKRKKAVARVWITPGSGKVQVNKMTPEEYFGGTFQSHKLEKPFEVTETLEQYDVHGNSLRRRQIRPGRCTDPRHLTGPARGRR